YESTLRVPLIMASVGANVVDRVRGAVVDVPVRHVDIVPTILDTVGLPVPATLPGHSLRTEADRRGGTERPSYFEAMAAMLEYGGAPLDGAIAGREKFIQAPLPELYDVGRDPAEAKNLIGANADRRRALESSLATFGATAPGVPRRENPESVARLRTLGY